MDFTVFSFAMAVVWTGIFAKLISILRKRMSVLQYFSVYPLLILLLFCILRIILPLELPYTIVIKSENIVPMVQDFFRTPFIRLGNIHISLMLLISIIWILGAIVILLRRLWNYYHFKRFLNFLPASEDKRLYHFFKKADTYGRLHHVKIIVRSEVESPAIVGCIHPVVLLPKIAFEDDELLGIFVHEISHYTYKHYFIKLIAEFISICFWWNPLFRTLSAETAHALEMHSDKAVCSRLNAVQQKKYIDGIVKVISNKKYNNIAPSFSNSLVEEMDTEKLQQRFHMILGNYYQNKRKAHFVILPFILSIFLLSYAVVIQPYSEPEASDYEEGMEIPDEDCGLYFVKTKDGYDLYLYPEKFIDHMDEIQDTLQKLRVYSSTEEANKK